MKRKIKIVGILFILIIIYIYVANITLFPKSVLLIQGEKLNLVSMWGVNLKEENENFLSNIKQEETTEASSLASGENTQVGKKDLNLNLFNIPISQVSVNVIPKTKVIPLRKCNRFKTIHRGSISCGNESNRRRKTI